MNSPRSAPDASNGEALQLSLNTPSLPPSISVTSSTPEASQADDPATTSGQAGGSSSITPLGTVFDEVVAAAGKYSPHALWSLVV